MAAFSDYLRNIFFLLLLLQFAPFFNQKYQKTIYAVFGTENKSRLSYLFKGTITSASYYTQILKQYFENNDIKGIVLAIDSGGGSAGASEALAHEIELLKLEHPKPIITYSVDICASGAYYIAATTFIITSPSTLIGSIGCYIPFQFKLRDFIEKHDIHYNMIKSGDYKVITDPFVNTTSEENALLQGVSDDSYQNFIEHVVKHRPALELDTAPEWANGKIYTGRQALRLGLIDRIGSQTDVINKIKEMAIIEGDIEWVKPERQQGLWGLLQTPDYGPEVEETWLARLVTTLCTILEQRYGQQSLHQ